MHVLVYLRPPSLQGACAQSYMYICFLCMQTFDSPTKTNATVRFGWADKEDKLATTSAWGMEPDRLGTGPTCRGGRIW
jgi:hypothetical protein